MIPVAIITSNIVIGVIVILCCLYRNNNTLPDPPYEIRTIPKQSEPQLESSLNPYSDEPLRPKQSGPRLESLLNPYPDKELKFTFEEELGKGYFGVVHKARMKVKEEQITVAIKKVRQNNEACGNSLQNELTQLKKIKDKPHTNLVEYIDCVKAMKGHEVWLVMEYCCLGQLHTFLNENHEKFLLEIDNENISSISVLKWCLDICNGMDHLHDLEIMHGDLRTDNILLSYSSTTRGNHPIAKIADFGISVSFYSYVGYKVQGPNFPWRWMAYEIIAHGRLCTLQSDVWSFGVLLWELLSLGKQPYLEYEKLDARIIKDFEESKFLKCPEEMKRIKSWPVESFYETISNKCFRLNHRDRASFSEIKLIVESFIDNISKLR